MSIFGQVSVDFFCVRSSIVAKTLIGHQICLAELVLRNFQYLFPSLATSGLLSRVKNESKTNLGNAWGEKSGPVN